MGKCLKDILREDKAKVKYDPNLEYVKEQYKYGGKNDNHKI